MVMELVLVMGLAFGDGDEDEDGGDWKKKNVTVFVQKKRLL